MIPGNSGVAKGEAMVSIRFTLPTFAAILALALFPAAAAGESPTAFPFQETFVGVNCCTGLDETVTVTGTFFVYERGVHGLSHRLDRTITTSSGFTGHGTEISVDHDRIFLIHDVLTNDAGQHMFAQFVMVQDAQGTVRVERFELRCAP
jgi:hypothetical protein